MNLIPIHMNWPFGDRGPATVGGRVGSPAIPMLAHVATPVEEADRYGPEATVTGVVCGDCSDAFEAIPVVRHATTDHVRACWAFRMQAEAEYLAELPAIRAGWL